MDGMDASIEGVLVGRHGGHYVLRRPRVIESEDKSVSLDGPEVWVPCGRVLFVQRMGAS